MAKLQTVVLLVGCVCVMGGADNASEQRGKLHNVVKSMLGFKDVPEKGTGLSDDMAPAYMLDLYEKYKNGRIQNGRTVANTVRSIHAEIGVVNSKAMFIFNLSSLSSEEQVLSAELHVHRKHDANNVTSGGAGGGLRAHLYDVSSASIHELSTRELAASARGWQVLQVSSELEDCLPDDTSGPAHSLALSIAHLHGDGDAATMTLRKVRRVVSRPFLVVFSNASQTLSRDHVSPHYSAAAATATATFVNPETGRRQRLGGGGRGRRRKKQRGRLADQGDVVFRGVDQKRSKRDIFDNKLPNEAYEPNSVSNKNNIPNTHPTILHGRTTSRLRLPSSSSSRTPGTSSRGSVASSSSSQLVPLTDEWPSSSLIPYPDDYKRRRRRRRRNRKHGKKNRKERKGGQADKLPLPEEYWEYKYNVIDAVSAEAPAQQSCGKRKLVVDFADIGWSDWIISPKSFEANYCAGTCAFPLSEAQRPSNHATIQAILEAIGLVPDVPAPCCVPDAMTSVTLLFFDHNRNVVLKNYPAMSVESCACR